MNHWKVKNPSLDQTKIVEEIYTQRGIQDYKKLFALDENDLHDPYLFQDMEKAVERIDIAIKNKERILVYGDYDVDGITSTYIMYKVIQDLGGNVEYDIPNRFIDGYGLSTAKAFEIINDEYSLVITVDNGIKSIEEAAILNQNDVDLIITDHHEMEGQLPKAYAIIHTAIGNYPFKPLAGVGVAFKVAQALIGDEALDYIDIASLGTIADMMPLVEENRAIVNLGLKRLKHSSNIGLKKLIEVLDINLPSVSDVQYKIAPRINSCGRMKSATIAVELLNVDNMYDAISRINTIEEYNNRRKKLTKLLYAEAIEQVDTSENAIIIHSPKMHEGVLGIVASRLANDYGKVSVVLKEEEYTYKGSIRSYSGVDVIEILGDLKDLLIRHGGHQNAAGLEFKKEYLQEFKQRFNASIPNAHKVTSAEAEGYIDIYKLGLDQIENLDKYDLRDALFVFEGIVPQNKYLIRGEHSKIIINHEIEGIFFSNKALHQKLYRGDVIDLLGRLDINTFRGKSKKQIIIDDYYIHQK
jgi:single-stranded-DNA-specific exonuclease